MSQAFEALLELRWAQPLPSQAQLSLLRPPSPGFLCVALVPASLLTSQIQSPFCFSAPRLTFLVYIPLLLFSDLLFLN